jgi:threonine dehydrogenase-like Zn-dependent dehydrogenase
VLGIAGKNGAFAEYMTLPLKNLHAVPDNVTETEAVFVEPLAAACEILEQVNVDGEMAVAVLGDGKLGLLIAQVMRLKTPHVDCYGKYDKKLRLLAGRGIQTFKSQEKTKKTYDLVIEATGSPSGIQQALTLVRPKGRIVLKSTVPAESSIEMAKVVVDEIMLIGSRCGPFDRAIHFLEQKLICVKELVDREFRLERGSEALAFAEEPEIIKVLLVP